MCLLAEVFHRKHGLVVRIELVLLEFRRVVLHECLGRDLRPQASCHEREKTYQITSNGWTQGRWSAFVWTAYSEAHGRLNHRVLEVSVDCGAFTVRNHEITNN